MIVIIDRREQAPISLPADIATARGTLATGDYSVAGLTSLIAVERKGHSDAWNSVLGSRQRFFAEWQRMGAIVAAGGAAACLLVGVADYDALRRVPAGRQVDAARRAAGVAGTYRAWSARFNVPVVFSASGEAAATWLVEWLREAAARLAVAAPVESGKATTP